MAVSLRLNNAIAYINWAAIGDLDGLYQATLKKAEQLGVASIQDRAPAPSNQAPTGNMRGILRFVESLDAKASKAEKRNLGVLLGTIERRLDQSGYQPTTTPAMRRIQRRRKSAATQPKPDQPAE